MIRIFVNIFDFISQRYIYFSSLILIAITILSLTPLSQLPEVPGDDKLHHVVAYAALMFPVALAGPRNWIFIALFFIGWSGGIELIQPYVNRYGEWADMLANSGGLLIGVVLAKLIGSGFSRRTGAQT